MARPNVEKPEYWSKEWYIEQKEKGLHDWEIAEQLYIHLVTFNRWKKELGIPKWKYTFSYAGRYKRK